MSRIYVYLGLILSLLSGTVTSSSFSSSLGSSRSILREVSDDSTKGDPRDYAVDLNATNFNTVLKDTPASFAVVEFFAHWCPACRNYKPHYEKVARLFNGPDAVHPGIILMTRVDCASKSLSYALLGPTGWAPDQDKGDIHVIDDGRTAERLLNWINKKMGSSFGLDDQKFENEHLSPNVSDPEQIARAVYDVEEATATAFDIIFEHKMIKPETRASLIKFLQLLVAHHPSRKCRKGAADLLVSFDDLYPTDLWSASNRKTIVEICSAAAARMIPEALVRIEDGESQFTFNAMCDFVHNFFICEECRQHFYRMCTSISNPFNKARDFALWLWNAHNKVNERLMKEEASLGTGDPKFPKMIWPPKQLCPTCYLDHDQRTNRVEWNKDQVFKFLTSYYGNKLASLYDDKDIVGNDRTEGAVEDLIASTNAVVVPVGAALAIAIASCGFGALACYWRSQQKSRKYFHQLHSLKNI
ncbi:sulfhydryl oxidase 2 isoform X1 [Senna tora]|uniref:Sulfhydryl oxidase n=1 Tax=Senna tora TaxID=362788 RepID=A0A834TT79_9FABA|nr:sulfhydryl oxidase 2 isoform X1 [Senna tora]